MKVKFYMREQSGDLYPWVEREKISYGDFDLLNLLLSSDLSSIEKVKEFEKTVFIDNDSWWFNATKAEIKNDRVLLLPAFDASDEMMIEIETFKEILQDWRRFLEAKLEVVNHYKLD